MPGAFFPGPQCPFHWTLIHYVLATANSIPITPSNDLMSKSSDAMHRLGPTLLKKHADPGVPSVGQPFRVPRRANAPNVSLLRLPVPLAL